MPGQITDDDVRCFGMRASPDLASSARAPRCPRRESCARSVLYHDRALHTPSVQIYCRTAALEHYLPFVG